MKNRNGIVARAYAKINWSLDVVGRRADGYHELDSLIQSISVYDTLTFRKADRLQLSVRDVDTGRTRAGDEQDLVLKAARALQAETGCSFGAHITLQKRIWQQAGLGGGSADCAATLYALNELWALGISRQNLFKLAERLGADVPFCLDGGFQRMRGFGDMLFPEPVSPEWNLLLIHPGKGLSTADVFKDWDQAADSRRPVIDSALKAIRGGEIAKLQRLAGNGLQLPAEKRIPEITDIQNAFYEQGALFAQMSGSGSAVFGVFEDELSVRKAHECLKKKYDKSVMAKTCAAGNALCWF